MNRFDGQTAVVTRAGAGLGRSIALRLSEDGARVVVGDVDLGGAEDTAAAIVASGSEAIVCQADVTSTEGMAAMVNSAVETWGGLDIAVNNAGVGARPHRRLHEVTKEEWERVVSVNLRGVWAGMKAQISHMITAGGGTVVNISSVMGLVGSPSLNSAHSASKHGVIGLTKTAALEYASDGIRINSICPEYIRTDGFQRAADTDASLEPRVTAATPMNRLGVPRDIADATAWLCSTEAAYITGHALLVDGGYTAR